MTTFTEVLQFAVQQHRANNLLEAEQLYRQLLEHQPTHPDVLHGLSTLSQQKGEYQQAERLPIAAMGRAGRQRAFEYFTWEQGADQTLQLYETLCN
ncbi:tetratricopeptide repeat protein [Dapis sp. BLCC M229]|uniref:glycosyltransferase n=1 Tax=Dapis sp. BLCC M229 TaxID=3400188 RepID=UPI003CF1FFDD